MWAESWFKSKREHHLNIDIMELIATLISVSSGLLSLLHTAYTVHRERNASQDEAVASLFTHIADTLDWTVKDFRAGHIPHGACAAMAQYAQEMPVVLTSLLPPNDVARYTEMLLNAHHVERLAISHAAGHLDLTELEKVAGTFRAAAVLARTRP